jgi:hypothetical protein
VDSGQLTVVTCYRVYDAGCNQLIEYVRFKKNR